MLCRVVHRSFKIIVFVFLWSDLVIIWGPELDAFDVSPNLQISIKLPISILSVLAFPQVQSFTRTVWKIALKQAERWLNLRQVSHPILQGFLLLQYFQALFIRWSVLAMFELWLTMRYNCIVEYYDSPTVAEEAINGRAYFSSKSCRYKNL